MAYGRMEIHCRGSFFYRNARSLMMTQTHNNELSKGTHKTPKYNNNNGKINVKSFNYYLHRDCEEKIVGTIYHGGY